MFFGWWSHWEGRTQHASSRSHAQRVVAERMRLHSDAAQLWPESCQALVTDPVQEILACSCHSTTAKGAFSRLACAVANLWQIICFPRDPRLPSWESVFTEGSAAWGIHVGPVGRSSWRRILAPPLTTTWEAFALVPPRNTPCRVLEWIKRISYISSEDSVWPVEASWKCLQWR